MRNFKIYNAISLFSIILFVYGYFIVFTYENSMLNSEKYLNYFQRLHDLAAFYMPSISTRKAAMIEAGDLSNFPLMAHIYAFGLLYTLIMALIFSPLFKLWANNIVELNSEGNYSKESQRNSLTRTLCLFLFMIFASFYMIIFEGDGEFTRSIIPDDVINNKWYSLRVVLFNIIAFLSVCFSVCFLIALFILDSRCKIKDSTQ